MHYAPNKTSTPPICEHSLHIWTLHLPKLRKKLPEYTLALSQEERKKVTRFKATNDQISYTLVRGGLRFILQKYLDTPANKLDLSVNLYGKPKIKATVSSTLQFNLSHSGDYAIYAITKNSPVGVDIEKIRIRSPEYLERLAYRFFSKNESKLIANTPETEITQLFFSLWTKKEAYTKQHGFGLHLPLSSFNVNISLPSQPSVVNTVVNRFSLPISQACDLPSPKGYCAAYSIAATKKLKVEHFNKS
ncbi:MAG: phosphopantetheine-protein transferase [Acidiferrobacteraceae bacterium]|nr:phosphopantetheine-protein transferase [Acidiferrobacteraceae bacterium]|tara:strand:- start:4439 stop:5179 length:741 start_codon:yes stop_codon:yes gene_type:complete